MSGEVIPFPNNDKSWDGDPTQSRRWTDRQGLVDSEAEEAYTELWVTHLNLPPRLEGELWHEWAKRTATERGVGSSALKLTEQSQQETA